MGIRANQVKWGSFLSYLQMGLNIVIGLIYTPLMIRMLGRSEYGLYNTVASTISSLSILSLGFNSSYIRYYSKYKNSDNQNGINNLNGLFIILFSLIGIVSFICGMFLTFHLDLVFSEGLTDQEYSIAKVLMLLLTVNLSISFPMSVFINIISAHEEFIFLKIVGMIRTVASPLIIIPLLYMGIKSIGIVVVTICLSLVADILYAWFVFAKLKCKFRFNHIELGLFRDIFVFSSYIAINIIVDQINTNIDKVLLGRFKGTSEVAIYAVAASLHSYYQTFSTSVSSVFTPRIHSIVNAYQNEKRVLRENITVLFVKVGRIQFIILGLIMTGIIFFGLPFIVNIWAGEGYDNSYFVTLLLIVPATVSLIENIGIEVQRALNLHKFRSLVYFVMAILNLLLSIYLCQLYGSIGSAVGTAIASIVANGIIMNIYYHKRCYIDIKLFWKSILQICKGMIIPVIFGIAIVCLLDLNRKLVLFAAIILYTIIYAISMWFFGINNYEKDIFRKPVMKVIHKVRQSVYRKLHM